MSRGKLNLQANDGAVVGLVVPDGLGSGERQIALGVNLSGITAYHLLSGNLSVSNEVLTNGFSTTLYTGNGGTQSIDTGIDMDTQWGNDASEKFGGLVWLKARNLANNHGFFDTIRGVQKYISSDTTSAEATLSGLTSFSNNGFGLGNSNAWNYNTYNFSSWNFQTTHRITGVTNHGKAYTCHYNPFTGFTIVKYEGSGIAGHEIPHHLGRKLGFNTHKNLSSSSDWVSFSSLFLSSQYIPLNLTSALGALANVTCEQLDNTVVLGSQASMNASAQQHIMYGWANSYFDESNKLIGNYEIGVYQGTGVAGNKVTTRGKPAWVMVKRLDSTGNWWIQDNIRTGGRNLYANLSAAEEVSAAYEFIISQDGFSTPHTNSDVNASGGQYLYMVVYDNDSGSGKSKYPRATDSSQLQLNTALIPFANGIDSSGAKNTIAYKNETITGLTLTAGKNYVYAKNDGTYGVSNIEPKYVTNITSLTKGETNRDYEFDVSSNKWVEITSTLSSEELTKETTLDFFGDASCKATYTLNGNTNDLSGNFNGASSSLTYTSGKFGQGANIVNGSHITLASSPFNFVTSNTTPWTYSFWCVTQLDLSSGQASLCSYTNAYGYCAFAIGANAIGSFAHSVAGGGSGTLYTGNSALSSWFNRVIPANTLITIVNTGSGFKLYENGVLSLSTGYHTTTGSGNITGNKVIGSSVNGSGYTFNGGNSVIDQIRVFNRALSDTEVARLSKYYSYSYSDGVPRNYLDAIVHADANGQLAYVEELPKIEYKDIIKANEFQGKNACTAYGEFNGAVTPPRLNDGFNIASIIRINTGVYDVYFKEPMDNLNYSVNYNTNITYSYSNGGVDYTKYLHKVTVSRYENGWYDHSSASIQIFGGKNS